MHKESCGIAPEKEVICSSSIRQICDFIKEYAAEQVESINFLDWHIITQQELQIKKDRVIQRI
jgi:hypothetical protein